MTAKMFLCTPFTGLGLYGGFRGNRWLRNRIAIFEQFVVPSILNQTDQDFTLWVCWRPEERENKYVKALKERLDKLPLRVVFTYSGVFMYDDKYEDAQARERFGRALNEGLHYLFDYAEDCDEVYVLLQPSDDCYDQNTVASIKRAFKAENVNAVAFEKGYICNYQTKEVRYYNPKTTPPFAAIRFPRATFFDPAQHLKYISLKKDSGKYKKGTPLPSHEYLGDCLQVGLFKERGFLVGCHGENISTHFNHPYRGDQVDPKVLENFGLKDVPGTKLPISLRKWLMRKLPHPVQRKLRFWFGEIIGNKLYNFLRA